MPTKYKSTKKKEPKVSGGTVSSCRGKKCSSRAARRQPRSAQSRAARRQPRSAQSRGARGARRGTSGTSAISESRKLPKPQRMRKAKDRALKKKVVVNQDFESNISEPMERSTVVRTRLASNSSQFKQSPESTGQSEQSGENTVYADLEMHETPPPLPPKKKDLLTTNSIAGGYRKKSKKNKRSRK